MSLIRLLFSSIFILRILFPFNPIINYDFLLLKTIELIIALNYYKMLIKALVYTSQTIIFPSHEQLKSNVSLLLNTRYLTYSE